MVSKPRTWSLIIIGNHEDPNGNPLAYTRMTQRGKWKRLSAQRYLGWKIYVQKSWLEKFGKYPFQMFEKDAKYKLDVFCYFKNNKHGDPHNIRGGIQDSIFVGDKRVVGSVEMDYYQYPRVEITVTEGWK